MMSKLKALEKRLLEDEGIQDLDAAQIEQESLKAAKLGSDELAKKLLAHPHYQAESKQLTEDYEVDPHTLARKIEVATELGISNLYGVGPARFGVALRKLAEANDVVGFMRLTTSYINLETSGAERRGQTKADGVSLAMDNIECACELADTYEKSGVFFRTAKVETNVTMAYFQRCHPSSPVKN